MFVVCGMSHSLSAPGSTTRQQQQPFAAAAKNKMQFQWFVIIAYWHSLCVFFDCALFGACHSIPMRSQAKFFFAIPTTTTSIGQQAAGSKSQVFSPSFFVHSSHWNSKCRAIHRLSTSIFILEDISIGRKATSWCAVCTRTTEWKKCVLKSSNRKRRKKCKSAGEYACVWCIHEKWFGENRVPNNWKN